MPKTKKTVAVFIEPNDTINEPNSANQHARLPFAKRNMLGLDRKTEISQNSMLSSPRFMPIDQMDLGNGKGNFLKSASS